MKIATILLLTALGAQAQAATNYTLKITNGSAMPLSPPIAYVKNGQSPSAQVGDAPTAGFVKICQTGDNSLRAQELGMDPSVTFVTKLPGMLQPGESREVTVEVQDPLTQSVQLETMYGKTKDLCALASAGSHSLYALQQHVTSEYLTKDNVVQTGAFTDPAVPMGRSYLDAIVCADQANAVNCLRSLAQPSMGTQKIRFFAGYLPSLTMLLENKYGATETQSLIVPTSGAVQFQLKLRH